MKWDATEHVKDTAAAMDEVIDLPVLKMMSFALNMMTFALKMMSFALQLLNLQEVGWHNVEPVAICIH